MKIQLPIDKTVHLFGLSIRFQWRSSKMFMGRFGGGWNWKVGAQWGKTILFSLLVAELRIEKTRKDLK